LRCRQGAGGQLCDIEQLRRCIADGGQGVAEHGVAERTGGSDDLGSGSGKLASTNMTDSLALLFAEKGKAAAGPAAEAALM
jgi:hypothetical protein